MVVGVIVVAAVIAYVVFLVWKVRVVKQREFVSHLHPEVIRDAFERKVATTGWKIIDAGNPMIAQSPLLGGIRQQVSLLLDPHGEGVSGSYETIRYVRKVLTGVPTKAITLAVRKKSFFKELHRLEGAAPADPPVTNAAPPVNRPEASPTIDPPPLIADQPPVVRTPPPVVQSPPPVSANAAPVAQTPTPTTDTDPIAPPPGAPATPVPAGSGSGAAVAEQPQTLDAALDGFDDDYDDRTVRRVYPQPTAITPAVDVDDPPGPGAAAAVSGPAAPPGPPAAPPGPPATPPGPPAAPPGPLAAPPGPPATPPGPPATPPGPPLQSDPGQPELSPTSVEAPWYSQADSEPVEMVGSDGRDGTPGSNAGQVPESEPQESDDAPWWSN